MDQKRRTRLDFWQNIAIVLLSFSAVVLLAQTQLYSRALPTDTGVSSVSTVEEDTLFTAPVRVAVSGSYGRYGSITLTTAAASEEFAPLGSLLGEVLSSAQMYTACTREDLLNALTFSSVYYDFLTPLPLSVLGGLVGAEGEDSILARHLVVTSQGGTRVLLYLWDDGDRFLTCTTALSSAALEALISGYELGNASFSFEEDEALYPLSLFVQDTNLPVLTAGAPAAISDSLLSSLAFNPHTQTRWTEEGGTEVIVDGDRSLRIREDGSLTYRSGGSDALTIGHSDLPTLWEAVTETEALLSRLCVPGNEAELYLKSVSRSGNATTLTFDYHFQGVPIRSSGGGAAAKVTLSGSVVSSITFTSREYHVTEEQALLLPLRQAAAIAAGTPGAELFIGYADLGDAQVSPQWLCE